MAKKQAAKLVGQLRALEAEADGRELSKSVVKLNHPHWTLAVNDQEMPDPVLPRQMGGQGDR